MGSPVASVPGSAPQPARTLTLIDCVGIGVNGIIGSGVYLMLGAMALRSGAVSVPGILACGLLCTLIALCFAELSGMFDRSGGAYVYARAAFGPQVGFAVGWMSLVTGVLSFAAVSRGFSEALTVFLPGLATPVFHLGALAVDGRALVAVALILGLGAINLRDVKLGARTSDVLSGAKLVPLIALVVVGLLHVRGDVLAATVVAPPGTGQGFWGALSSTAFFAVFMLSGFEYVPVPAGEAKDARHNVPRAIVGSLTGATLLYVVIQLVALSVVPDLAAQPQPLVATAQAIFGGWGRPLFGVAALISMAGFCSSSALVGPRYLVAFAQDGYLPARLTALTRFGTPGVATVVSSLLAAALALTLGYASMVDVGNIALFAQYIPACLAMLVLRVRQPDAPRRYRLPAGPLVAVLAAGFSIALVVKAAPGREELIFSAQLLSGGFVLWAVLAAGRALRRGVSAGTKPAS